DAHHVRVSDVSQDGAGAGDGDARQALLAVRDHLPGRRAHVDGGLEDDHALGGEQRAMEPPDELFRLPAEHAAGDDLDPAGADRPGARDHAPISQTTSSPWSARTALRRPRTPARSRSTTRNRRPSTAG